MARRMWKTGICPGLEGEALTTQTLRHVVLKAVAFAARGGCSYRRKRSFAGGKRDLHISYGGIPADLDSDSILHTNCC